MVWELDCKESWVPKNWCFRSVVLEKTLESPLDCKEIQPVHPKRNQSWIFIGRTDVEAETPIYWPPNVKSQLIGKTLILGKIEGRKRRGWQRMRWLDGIANSMDMSLSKHRELVMRLAVHGVAKTRTWVRGWNELNWIIIIVMATAALKSPTMYQEVYWKPHINCFSVKLCNMWKPLAPYT